VEKEVQWAHIDIAGYFSELDQLWQKIRVALALEPNCYYNMR